MNPVKPEVAINYLEGLANDEKWEARAISLRQVIATIEQQEAEIERLRAALRDIKDEVAGNFDACAYNIAKAALEV